jgi:hypothetical protein
MMRWLVIGWAAAFCVAFHAQAGARTLPHPPGDDAAALIIDGPPPPVPPEVESRDGDERVTVRAVRIEQPIELDGQLDEPVYETVPAISNFVQQEPYEGQPATEATDVWIFFDDSHLYVTFRCWDSQPDRIVANELRRDNANIFQGDSITIALDTFYDRRTGFFFQTNALGAVRDALIGGPGSTNYDWQTVWDVRSRRFDGGWTSEMAIPFKSLRYNEQRQQIWSMNVRRILRWKNETTYLTRVPASYGVGGIGVFASGATLVGIETPPSSRNIEIKPYGITQLTTDREADPPTRNDVGGDFGVDFKYGLTRSLILDLTYNTDFSQVEADEQQINLTRFSLLFAEKRDFFLEGSSIFDFGLGGGDAPILFFSRQIGLSDGQPVAIRGGGRLTGRAGTYSVGLLNIQTGEEDSIGAEATNFSVVRVKRDVLRRSSVGAMATSRSISTIGDGSNQAAGLDAAFRFYDNVELGGYYARTWTPGVPGDEDSYQARFDYGADRYGLQFEHLKVGDAFNPEVGFLRRDDFRRNYVLGRFSPRPRSLPGIRRVSWEASLDRFDNGRGELESREMRGVFRVDLENGDSGSLTYADSYEVLSDPFRVAGRGLVPAGVYDFGETRASYRFGPQRRLVGSLSASRGGFFGGQRSEAAYDGRLEVTPRLSVEPRISFNWIDLPDGSFSTRLISTRATYTATPRMFVGALLQYNSSSNTFTANARFRWEYSPGSDLFVVFTEGRNTATGPLERLVNRGVAVKLTRLLRF